MKTNLFVLLLIVLCVGSFGCAHRQAVLETESVARVTGYETIPVAPVAACDATDVYLEAFLERYNEIVIKTKGKMNEQLNSSLASRQGNVIHFVLTTSETLPPALKLMVREAFAQQIDPCREFFVVLPGVEFSVTLDDAETRFSCDGE